MPFTEPPRTVSVASLVSGSVRCRRAMLILDCRDSEHASAAWHACVDAAEQAGAAPVTEELRSNILGTLPHFAGFARWNGVAERSCLAVVVEGPGWAMDDTSRVGLHAGQAAMWRAGEFCAFGGERDTSYQLKLKPFCRMLLLTADELPVEQLLAVAGAEALESGARVARELSSEVPAMRTFDCESAAGARACYEDYLSAEPRREGGMSRSSALGGGVYGGHFWDRQHLAVFVEGSGWAADDRTRQVLRPGQGAFWPAGSWFACGKGPGAEIRMVGGVGVSVDAFLRHRPPPQ